MAGSTKKSPALWQSGKIISQNDYQTIAEVSQVGAKKVFTAPHHDVDLRIEERQAILKKSLEWSATDSSSLQFTPNQTKNNDLATTDLAGKTLDQWLHTKPAQSANHQLFKFENQNKPNHESEDNNDSLSDPKKNPSE